MGDEEDDDDDLEAELLALTSGSAPARPKRMNITFESSIIALHEYKLM